MAKKLFIWVSITSMTAHLERGMIEFRAGFITEDVPASLFEKIPVCVDGVGEQLRGAAGVVRELGLLPVAEVDMDREFSPTFGSEESLMAKVSYQLELI
ncbi:hypothetical protein TRIUR3_16525 [Triticum urartu]|uniref:Uncharacterized protein n=1 Tax=Triticum urartu TaxID=4572 RepID=M7YIS3_TRIUA|nr:hypothetical protein TRIUR3_16525 [Triticum urartu]